VGGMVSYRLYVYIKEKAATSPDLVKKTAIIYAFLCLFFCLGYQLFPYHTQFWTRTITWCYFAVLFVSIPFLFYLTKNNKVDRFFADLSYPLYISHFLTLYAIKIYFPGLIQNMPAFLAVIGFSVIVSIGWLYIVVVPVEKYRIRVMKKNRLSISK
jgi:peptidoglycan/LPS O-acetylase OafA/YrhL